MSPLKKKYKKEYAISLIRIAEGDLKSAVALANDLSGRRENILFTCQQVLEKTLKAVLCHLEIAILLTHDLEALLAQLPDKNLPPHAAELKYFTPYATIRRYEEGFEEVSTEEISKALQITKVVLSWGKISVGEV